MWKRRRVLLLAVFGLAACLAFCVVGLSLHSFRGPTNALWDQVEIGDSEESVRSRLGEPLREYEAAMAPEDYYLSGYGRRERTINKRVLICTGADMVMYVWIDDSGLVEDLFRGGS
ncbi:MAG: hypothetical protein ACYSUI_03555 [Planctomycetota bacterium]|jgi:hypothetical protein